MHGKYGHKKRSDQKGREWASEKRDTCRVSFTVAFSYEKIKAFVGPNLRLIES